MLNNYRFPKDIIVLAANEYFAASLGSNCSRRYWWEDSEIFCPLLVHRSNRFDRTKCRKIQRCCSQSRVELGLLKAECRRPYEGKLCRIIWFGKIPIIFSWRVFIPEDYDILSMILLMDNYRLLSREIAVILNLKDFLLVVRFL